MAIIVKADIGKPVIEYIRVIVPEILKDDFHFGIIAIVQHQQLEVLQRLRKKGVNQYRYVFIPFVRYANYRYFLHVSLAVSYLCLLEVS